MTSPDVSKPGTYHLNDGTTLTVQADGTRVIVQPSGKRIVQDRFGNIIDTGDPRAGKGRTSLDPTTGKTATETRKDKEAAAKRAADPLVQQANNQAAALQTGAANAARGYVWVNGQLSHIVGFDKSGNPIVNYVGGGQTAVDPKTGKTTNDPTRPASVTTAFGALPTSTQDALNSGNGIFNLSTGPADIFSGATLAGDGFGGQTPTYGPGDHSQSANTVGTDPNGPQARNQMTVAQGVQWFLNLSVQHPDQYKRLTDMLKAAHYVTAYTGDAGSGSYSSDMAAGFAKAAADLATVNTTQGGANLGLYDFLAGKAKTAGDNAAATVQPVNRNYQDPATLAYAARSAAQSVLGRNLTPAEEKAFESQFRGKENAYYNNQDATNQAQASAATNQTRGPANTVAAPDTTGEASQYVQGDQFTTQRQGYSMLEYLKAFQQLLGSGKAL